MDRNWKRDKVKRNFSPYIFIFPALLVFLIFFIFPNAYVFYLSLHELGPGGEPQENWAINICPRYQDENNTYSVTFDIKQGRVYLDKIFQGEKQELSSDNFSSGRVGRWYKLRIDVLREENLDNMKTWIIGIENGYKIFDEVVSQALPSNGLALSAWFNRDFDLRWDDLRIRKYSGGEPRINIGEEIDSNLDNWARYKPITIEGIGTSLEDYQLQLNITYSENMREDFGDIRFTQENELALLDYWIEEYSLAQMATIWIKVPAIPEENTTTVYMHYGNPDATTTSNIHTTFVFGDDFENSTWTGEYFSEFARDATFAQGAENGEYFMHGGAGDKVGANIRGNLVQLPENFIIEVNVNIEKVGTREYGLVFVGAQNFTELFSDSTFLLSLLVVAGIVIQSIVVQVPAGLGLAIVLRKTKGSRTFSTIFFLPMTISLVTICLMWRYMVFSPQGILYSTLGLTLDPTKDPLTLFIAVNLIADWIYIGLYTLIFSSALKSIPNSVFDAARVDGLSGFKTLRKVVIPALKNIILVTIIMTISGTFKTFDTWWVLGGGATAPLHLPSTYLVTNIGMGLIGYASTIAVVSFFITLTIILFQLRAMKVKL